MAGHTKGPLYANRRAWGSTVTRKPNGKYADTVAECMAWINGASGQPGPDEAHANALLFAAASGLLKAAEAALTRIEQDYSSVFSAEPACASELRAAINRARTGEGG